MVKKLKNLLFEISQKPMFEQKPILEKTFDDWKGNNKRRANFGDSGIAVRCF